MYKSHGSIIASGLPKSLVLITGAAGGLGKAFAVECASRGWDLYLTDLREDALMVLSASLETTYAVRVRYSACDLSDACARVTLFDAQKRQGLRFWALINVAGIDHEGFFYEQTHAQISSIVRLNIEGTIAMTHGLLAQRDPLTPFRIINVASLAAFYPMPVKATYAASKRFLLDFSLALREEVRDLGATVTVLCPAGLPTTQLCIEAIEAQGWMGYATTCDIGAVAASTLDAALKGKAVYIPGWINRTLRMLGSFIPAPLVAHMVGQRWKEAQTKRTQGARQDQALPIFSFAVETGALVSGARDGDN